MPTDAELCGMAFDGGSAGSQGLTAAALRIQYAKYGEVCRAWNFSMDAAKGKRTYSEVEFPEGSDYRVMVYDTPENYERDEFGWLKKGQTGLSAFRSEIPLADGWRIALTNPLRARIHYERLVRQGSSMVLPRGPVAAVQSIVNVSGFPLVADLDYEASDTSISFLSDAVQQGEAFVIAWTAYPTYEVVNEVTRESPIGQDGELLPIRFVVKRVNNPLVS